MSTDSFIRRGLLALIPLLAPLVGSAQLPAKDSVPSGAAMIRAREGGTNAWVLRKGAQRRDRALEGQLLDSGDRIYTGERTSLILQAPDHTVVRMRAGSELQISLPSRKRTLFNLVKGFFFFFHRGEPTDFEVISRTTSATIRGTEFVAEVDENGRMTLSLLDGVVDLTNAVDSITLVSKQQGMVEPGQGPVRVRSVINTMDVIQWCLYYPAVLDVADLGLTVQEEELLEASLSAYRSGDLPVALANYPPDRQPQSAREKVFLGALLLAVGEVEQTQALLGSLAEPDESLERLARAVNGLVAAVQFKPWRGRPNPSSATEWLAASYHEQSLFHLEEARNAARNAVLESPSFGLALARLAELEFSFGQTDRAYQAVEKSLRLAPRNAQALALKGFLLAAQNKMPEAIEQFDQAIAVEAGLGNAWLGRGLSRIRKGDAAAGLVDLEVAAALEPQRALFRSYLGKAFSNAGVSQRAKKELELAKQMDPNDPTAWLYSALLHRQNSRINEAVRDLEKSKELNDNRQRYRSRLLLDQDRAVRGANLAAVYEDAGMVDVSAREAARAVSADYANYSAHLFLANSYNELRDPNQVNLRYETPWLSEFLVANLLAPVGASTLSQTVSEQEYSKLFERDRLGLVSVSEFSSNGDSIQAVAQFGTWGNFAYALEANYRSENGQRMNNDLEQATLSLRLKQQVTPQDSIYLQSTYYSAESGDVAQRFDPNIVSPVRSKETQEPILLGGYHHEWSPGSHTLFLAARLEDTFELSNPEHPVLLLAKEADGEVGAVAEGFLNPDVGIPRAPLDYQNDLEIYSAELQHLWQTDGKSVVLGGRFQAGQFKTKNQLGNSTFNLLADATGATGGATSSPVTDQDLTTDLQRISVYGYHYWQAHDSLLLTVGLSYDQLHYPLNLRNSPISDQEETTDELSPKAGLIWTPLTNTALRLAYTRSLGGASFDQSFRLEPTLVGGHNQAHRSFIPESVVGALAGERFETWALALDQKFGGGTYLSVHAELLDSEAEQTLGVFELPDPFSAEVVASSTKRELDYQERNLILTLNQLIGTDWSVGAQYRLSDADLNIALPEIPSAFSPLARSDLEATLQQLHLFVHFNHDSGFFSQFESIWSEQSNRGYTPDRPGDEFWQFNAFLGYRFPQRRAELRLGLLNITDQDYRLNPLNLTPELPRDRTFTASFRLNF